MQRATLDVIGLAGFSYDFRAVAMAGRGYRPESDAGNGSGVDVGAVSEEGRGPAVRVAGGGFARTSVTGGVRGLSRYACTPTSSPKLPPPPTPSTPPHAPPQPQNAPSPPPLAGLGRHDAARDAARPRPAGAGELDPGRRRLPRRR